MEEQKKLLLPILIGVSSGESERLVICHGMEDEKVISKVLNMPVSRKQKGIAIYEPQLAVTRKLLRTTTQCLFPPKL